ncbi:MULTISPECIES: nuclease-related domain-containing protein [unclassified Bradyrhizobium]|uniref:nuclease-related domain-containing protein n=1 Tax=unclassified Bradyrhizobium TaxID=2631580 RepID=UPI001FF75937|nr:MULTISPECIES: nuclease-related domain-containing protein [unclassified Bradyrhizobium]MCK1714157.1 NERD domain-containing protein [Bradyrhizobium sp. 143]MCK1725248.1 NERD domain-containing protein [Bradyrhizobium sp. 142]
MAIHISCGMPKPNEVDAIRTLSEHLFEDEWALLTNVPRTVVPREIDACLLGPKGMIVIELKNHQGEIRCHGIGSWEGIPDSEANPLEQAEECAQKLKGWLTYRDPSLREKVYVDSIVVMTHPECRLEIGQEIADRVGCLPDTQGLVEIRIRKGLEVGIPERIFKLITGKDPPPELIERWHTAKRIVGKQAPPPKEKASVNKTVDTLRRVKARANELERTDAFPDHATEVGTLIKRFNQLSLANCANREFIPSVDGFLGATLYILNFLPASEKDFDEFKRIQMEHEHGSQKLRDPDARQDYNREFALRLNKLHGLGTRWHSYQIEEIHRFGLGDLKPDDRFSLINLAGSYFDRYAVLYDQALAVFEDVAKRHDRIQAFQAHYKRLTAPSNDKANDLPPEWVRGWYRGWPGFQWAAGPVLIVDHTKNRLRIMSDLLTREKELLELCE